MSRREPKAGEWLRQQIEELGALRNASVRDPQFKAWRQNTLTFIQRIWPGDTTKSERFRRIPFTPPSTKHDPRAAREYYERGCGEALEYLNALLASLGGAVAAETVAVETERHPESFEGDFPEVDLGGGPPAPVGAAPPAKLDDSPIDRSASTAARGEGPPELPSSAGRLDVLGTSGDFLASAAFLDPESATPGRVPSSGGSEAPRAPLPPAPRQDEPANASRISVRGSVPRERPAAETTGTPSRSPRSNPLADILGPAREQARKEDVRGAGVHVRKDPPRETPRDAHREAPRETPREASKNGRKKAKTPKPRLKDMLGLASLEQAAAETPAPPPAPSPIAADLTRETPHPASLEAPGSVASATPSPAAPAAAPRLEVETDREIPSAPDATPAFAGGLESGGGWSLPEFMTPAAEASRRAAAPPAEAAAPGDAGTIESNAATGAAAPEEMHEALSAAHVESLPASDDTAAAPPVPPAASDEDAGHAARVTAEFLDKSPVMSSTPRPVTRRTPGSARQAPLPIAAAVPSNDSVASRVLAIAAEVDQLGVPEGHRARARAALMDLARQLDESEIAWDVLRDAVHFVMEFPPLARRTLPLLLPYLDRAA